MTVGTSHSGVLWRATQAGIAVSAAQPRAIGGGGSVGDRRPRAPDTVTSRGTAFTRVTAITRTTATTMGWRLADLAISHPVGTTTLIATRLLGWPLRRCLGAAAVVDQGLPALTARSSAAPARFLRLWTHASRFHRRWPSSLDRSKTAMEREVSVGRQGSRLGVAQTSEPITSSTRLPVLARLPHRIDGTTVAWAVDLDHADDPGRLGVDLAGLSRTDPWVLTADIGPRPTGAAGSPTPGSGSQERWEVTVDFDIEPPPWALSVVDRTAFFHPIEHEPTADHPHEEGDTHGNG